MGLLRPDRKLRIDSQGKLFNQSRRFRLALPRDGRLDFAHRNSPQDAIPDAVLPRDTEAAVRALLQDIESEMTAGA